MEKLYLKIQQYFFSKKCMKNLYFLSIILYIIFLYLFKEKISLHNDVFKELNNNIFSLSGILAGFLFTSLGIFVSSDSEIIKNLKATENLSIMGNFFIYSIFNYIIVIIITLIELFITNTYICFILLLFKIFSFLFATLLLCICLYFIKKIIFVDKA